MTALLSRGLFALFTLFLALSPAGAVNIERVVSPGGVEAWLVRESATPLIAVEFAFRGGGASQDPPGKEGATSLMAAMLDEGAGPFDSRAFQERMEALAMRMSFSAGRENVTGSFQTLSANRDAAFDMLRLALTEPRFAEAELNRARQAAAAQLRREQTNPNSRAGLAFSEVAFPNHPYGRPTRGTLETIGAITRADLAAQHRRLLTRDALKIAVVGDIDAATLAGLLDRVFGALPATGARAPIPETRIQPLGARRIVEMDTPQTVMNFALPGPKRADPDFIPLFVVNHILGGGSFTSRLWTEVREQGGLTYSISTGLSSLPRAAMFLGQTSTRNDRAGEALLVIEAAIRRMAQEGPTEDELKEAKTYLTGSYLLRFETSENIAEQLLAIQLDDLGIDWIERRNATIEAVTLDDARRVAQRWLTGPLLVVMAGKPQGAGERPATQ